MNRTFTLLLVLFISVTLSAQESTVSEPQIPETYSSRLKQDILKKLDRPEKFMELFNMDSHVEGSKQKSDVKSGRPLAGAQDDDNAFPGLDEAQKLKSAVAEQKRLDSIVSDLEIEVFEYDEDGNNTSTVVYSRDTITDPYVLDWKMEATFNEDGRITMQAEYSWVDSLKAWIGDWKQEATFDENGRQTVQAVYSWVDSLIAWIGDWKNEQTFDEDGNRTALRFYDWGEDESKSEIKSAESGFWRLIEEWLAKYDAEGNETDFSIFGLDEESGEWIGFYIQNLIFGPNGIVTSSTSSSIYNSTSSEFELQFKLENEHDANDNLTKWEESKWEEEVAKSESNANAGEWVYTLKGENTFDANDNILTQAWFTWDLLLTAWAGTTQFVYTYDEDENTTSYTFLFWDAVTSTWVNWTVEIYTYEDGNHVKTVTSNWDFVNEKWNEVTMSDFTFNSDGIRTSTETYNKDMVSEEWILSYMEARTYNDKKLLISSIVSTRDEESGEMIVQTKTERSFDDNGSMLSSAYYSRDFLTDVLIGRWRVDYTRDNDGNVLTFTDFLWLVALSDWVPDSKLDYTYDYDFTGSDIRAPFFMWAMITSIIEYAYQEPALKSTEDWNKIDEFNYYYSDLAVSAVDDIARGELSIYPNPATEYIQVEGDDLNGSARIVMYNVSGRMVMNQVLDRGGRIPVSHLSEGIYVIRLVQGDKVKTAKVMIE